MTTFFLDTGYLIALELVNDQNHKAALRHWQDLVASGPRLVTTAHVLAETVTFFNHRGHHAKAVAVGNMLLRSPSVDLIHPDQVLFSRAWAYFQRRSDKDCSFTDCLSFVVMQELGTRTALTFDSHFLQAGFVIEP
jgi:predicted nucleic acid-binding protein